MSLLKDYLCTIILLYIFGKGLWFPFYLIKWHILDAGKIKIWLEQPNTRAWICILALVCTTSEVFGPFLLETFYIHGFLDEHWVYTWFVLLHFPIHRTKSQGWSGIAWICFHVLLKGKVYLDLKCPISLTLKLINMFVCLGNMQSSLAGAEGWNQETEVRENLRKESFNLYRGNWKFDISYPLFW